VQRAKTPLNEHIAEQNAFCWYAGVLALQTQLFQRMVHGATQRCRLEGLAHVFVRAVAQGSDGGVHLVVRAHDDHTHIATVALHAIHDVHAGHVRQAYVEQRQVDFARREQLECIAAIAAGQDLAVRLADQLADRLPDPAVVIDQKDAGGLGRDSGRRGVEAGTDVGDRHALGTPECSTGSLVCARRTGKQQDERGAQLRLAPAQEVSAEMLDQRQRVAQTKSPVIGWCGGQAL